MNEVEYLESVNSNCAQNSNPDPQDEKPNHTRSPLGNHITFLKRKRRKTSFPPQRHHHQGESKLFSFNAQKACSYVNEPSLISVSFRESWCSSIWPNPFARNRRWLMTGWTMWCYKEERQSRRGSFVCRCSRDLQCFVIFFLTFAFYILCSFVSLRTIWLRWGDYRRENKEKHEFYYFNRHDWWHCQYRSYCVLTTEDHWAVSVFIFTLRQTNCTFICPTMTLIHIWEFQRTVSFWELAIKKGSSVFEILVLGLQVIFVVSVQMNVLIAFSRPVHHF